jgi:hypothetical protein
LELVGCHFGSGELGIYLETGFEISTASDLTLAAADCGTIPAIAF